MWIGDTFVRADKVAGKPADKPAVKPADKPTGKPADKPAENKTYTKALAKAIDKMPDIYELYDEEERFIGQGSVQKFSLSQDLRSKSSTAGTWVTVQWRSEFNGYEIVGLLCDAPNTI
jgi:hypothetical protein